MLDKRIYNSPDGKWTLVKKNWEADIDGGYTELEFYSADSYLHGLQFVLNKGNKDSHSIYVIDLNDRKIIKIISLKEPYNMIIP